MSLAVEFAGQRTRVETMTPGPVKTPIAGKMGLTPEHLAGTTWKTREAEEIADAARYFALESSRFTTGTELRVDD
jgi:NAD(P)-dependent dehydrogenase (short-subunit alcohol dehydrogenase family)